MLEGKSLQHRCYHLLLNVLTTPFPTITQRLAKLFRLFRLIKVAKLLKLFFVRGQVQVDEVISADENIDIKMSVVGRKMTERITKKGKDLTVHTTCN